MGARTGPDADGWVTWTPAADEGFGAVYGPIRTRVEGAVARCRVETGPGRVNPGGFVHGGFLLAFLDHALFAGATALGPLASGRAVTLSVSTQFVAPGAIDQPLDAVIELVRETGTLIFLRGVLEQRGGTVLTFEAMLRRIAARRPA